MESKGTVLIVGLGSSFYDVIDSSKEFWVDHSFNSSVVVPEAYLQADRRKSLSQANKMFVYRVSEARESGLNVVLLTTRVDMLDKRLVDGAITIQLVGK